ncbi:hypothetical protein GCM10007301_48550 [Azorhizobium oxalatiphilum]|uniref:Uncharacterized protein n=1 Tax=Azorhizobium oxalatiphilum TaxID=980631 RepID=A0A917CDP9_9HYPH|nr:hypothetical protein [Azorhizobium oxalatiphilum]GGF82732.1 hypothetical protein GCM10007301_48550 [Azorhizobium oxalatiphilum]
MMRRTALADQVRSKELGLAAHFLDGVWTEAPRAAVVTTALIAGLMQFQGSFSPAILGISLVVGQVVSFARGFSNYLDAERNARTFDNPRVQAYLRRMHEASGDVVIAAQRGTAWIVMHPASENERVEVLSEVEYEEFRERAVANRISINEVRVVRKRVSNTRIRSGYTHAPEERRIADMSATGQLRYSASRFLAVGSGITEDEDAFTAPGPGTAA